LFVPSFARLIVAVKVPSGLICTTQSPSSS